jgi:NADPH2:quinone reductase
LAQKGSLVATRPSLWDFIATRKELVSTANDLFDVLAKGAVKVQINQTFALKDAAKAHSAMEGRRTTGSSVLIP